MIPGSSFHASSENLFQVEESTYSLSRLLHGDGASSSGDGPDDSEYDTHSTAFSEVEDAVPERHPEVGVPPRETTQMGEEDEFSELEDDEERYVLSFMPIAILIWFDQAARP